MYLIMKCIPLNDQYECDADRTPITMTDDWQKWYNENKNFDYDFEVWEFVNNHFECIKDCDTPMEEGMVLVFLEDDESEPIIIQKFPNLTRDGSIPDKVKRVIDYADDVNDWLFSRGLIEMIYGNTSFMYTEYTDRNIFLG